MFYRNQTNTIQQITNLSHIRITTVQEAVAFLRAIQPLQTQVAEVLQRSSVRIQQEINRATKPTHISEESVTRVVEEVPKVLVPEELTSDEGFTEADVEEKVDKLKKARK